MSVTVFINGRNTEKSRVKEILSYIERPEATCDRFMYGNGLNPKTAYEDMLVIQNLYRKKDVGKRYIHYVVSFDSNVTSEEAYEVAKEIAAYPKFADDYQYLLAVHTNTNNVHAHVVINAVNVHTLGKFSQSKAGLNKFKDYANQILMKHHLEPVRKSKDIFQTDLLTDEKVDECLESFFAEDQADAKELIGSGTDKREINNKKAFKGGENEDYEIESLGDDNYYDDYSDNYGDWDDYYDDEIYEVAEERSRLEKEAFVRIEKGEDLSDGVACEDIYNHYEQFLESQKTEDELIQEAEIQSNIQRSIIAYFEGKKPCLPDGINYNDAFEFWEQWQDANNFQEEY